MSSLRKYLLIAAGTASVALGIIGIFLPILPTTPFLLLSAWCYARSSRRFYLWLTNNPLLGTYISNYIEKRGVPLRTKVFALLLLWASILFSAFFAVRLIYIRILLLVIASCVTLHILQLKTLYPAEEQVEQVWNE